MPKKEVSKQFIEKSNVQFVGLNELDEDDQARVKEVLYNHAIQLERELKRITMLRLHFKVYQKGGRKKYSVTLFIDAPTGPIEVHNMYEPAEWDAVACVHKLLEKAKKQIIHKFKTDSDYKKSYF